MKQSKERPWIGNRKGKEEEADLAILGEDLPTMRHQKKERAGMKLRGWPETGPHGGVLLTPCVP